MNCENYLGIYENNGQCGLHKIELDSVGLCKECIYVDFDNEFLEQKSKK